MPMGEELEVVEQLDGWVKVSIDSDEGYVSADYIEINTEPVSYTHLDVYKRQGKRRGIPANRANQSLYPGSKIYLQGTESACFQNTSGIGKTSVRI